MSNINKNSLYFHLLTEDYFNIYNSLDEFQEDVSRGHGVMILGINDLLIAIPLRSGISENLKNARHIFPYTVYEKSDGRKCLKALDFSKLTIIKEEHIDYSRVYHFKDIEEKKFYLSNSNRIFTRVKNYVQKYIDICNKIEQNKLITKQTLQPYQYSTLRNFHSELGVAITKELLISRLLK